MIDIYIFLPELLGSLIGAFLGYWLGVRQERKMRIEENKEEKKEYITALTNEIKFNNMELNKEKEIEIKGLGTVQTITHSYFTYSFDSGINSGKYSSLSPQIQLELAILYNAFKKLNEVRNYHKMTMTRTNRDLMNIAATVKSLCTNLKRRLPITVKLLENLKDS